MAKFESHITFAQTDEPQVRALALVSGWTYSAFDADPVLGNHHYCYLTAYDTDAAALCLRMSAVAEGATGLGAIPLRQKIERIIYDTKTGVNELNELNASCRSVGGIY